MAGSIGETNRFAQTMLMLVPLGIFRVFAERSLTLRVVAGVMTLALTLGVVLSFSRGGAVGLLALVIVLLVMRLIKIRHVLLLVVVLVAILAVFPQYANRLTSLVAVSGLDSGAATVVDNSLLSRATETLAAALVIVDHPVVGVGPSMFSYYYEQYANVVGILVRNDVEREAHNLYLGIGAELGIPGLIAFLMVALLTVRSLLAARRASLVRRPDLERLTTPFLLALMTYYVTGMFLHLSFGRFYWIDAGRRHRGSDHHAARDGHVDRRRTGRRSRGSGPVHGSETHQPVGVAEVLAGPGRCRGAVRRPVAAVDDPGLPLVVAIGDPAHAPVQELRRP